MITIEMLEDLFGGSLPDWFWVIGSAVIIGVAVWWFLESLTKPSKSKSASGPKAPKINVGRNSDGSFYAYDDASGKCLYTAATREEVNEWKKANYPSSSPAGGSRTSRSSGK